MDYNLAKKLIEDDILDFQKMMFKNYKFIGLSEIEAFIIIELHNQMRQGNTFLNPSKIIKNITISKDELLTILDSLIKKGYLSIQLKKTKSGKDTEIFFLDGTIQKILLYYQKVIKDEIINQPKKYETNEEELVDMIESQFQKLLTPLEIEIIQKWLSEDHFEMLEIKKALLDAIKANKYSISYVDSILIKRRAKLKKSSDVVYNPEKSEALKAFFDSWEKKQ
ncbi:MAG: DnaD domain protein [Firmicutes bacterium]|nr:DnaD domain protein [Bacillota bacterium]